MHTLLCLRISIRDRICFTGAEYCIFWYICDFLCIYESDIPFYYVVKRFSKVWHYILRYFLFHTCYIHNQTCSPFSALLQINLCLLYNMIQQRRRNRIWVNISHFEISSCLSINQWYLMIWRWPLLDGTFPHIIQ